MGVSRVIRKYSNYYMVFTLDSDSCDIYKFPGLRKGRTCENFACQLLFRGGVLMPQL